MENLTPDYTKELKAENGGKEVDLPGKGTMGFMRNHPRVMQGSSSGGVALFLVLTDAREKTWNTSGRIGPYTTPWNRHPSSW